MDLEENEARNGCAGEGQEQFNRPTDQASKDDNSYSLAIIRR
jgi:hypothetical protein